MINRHRGLSWAAGGLAVVLLLAALALHALLDEENLKVMARERVKAAWGRDLAIGTLSLRLRPLPALHATGISLSNPSWTRQRSLLEADSLNAHLDLLPLLHGQVVVKSVDIDGVKANLETSADGGKSWELRPADASPRPAPATSDKAFDPLQLISIRLRDARIVLRDSRGQEHTWDIDLFRANGEPGWRQVKIETRLTRNGHPMEVQAEFADLSRVGSVGATSEGTLEARCGPAWLKLSGQLPLEASLKNHALKAELQAESLNDALGFFGIVTSGATAPVRASADLREAHGRIAATKLKILLGKTDFAGDARIALAGGKPGFEARLMSERMDWGQFVRDIGLPAPAPKPPGELFNPNPLPWPLLAAMKHVNGVLDVQIRNLRLRSGTLVQNAKGRMAIDGERANISGLSYQVFGGSVAANLQLDARAKNVKLELTAENTQLGPWLEARGRKGALAGGPMKIEAEVAATGGSMKELAASLTGPVTIRVGNAKLFSKKLQQAETLLIGLAPVFSAKDADHVELVCLGARLPFSSGRAQAEPIAGARSEASQLLTSGYVDLRQQTLDLRGKVRARSGISLGMSALTGDVRIAGKLLQPEVGLDPEGVPGAVARLGAAVLTGGASILATAVWDAAVPETDACNLAAKDTPAPQNGRKKKLREARTKR